MKFEHIGYTAILSSLWTVLFFKTISAWNGIRFAEVPSLVVMLKCVVLEGIAEK